MRIGHKIIKLKIILIQRMSEVEIIDSYIRGPVQIRVCEALVVTIIFIGSHLSWRMSKDVGNVYDYQ